MKVTEELERQPCDDCISRQAALEAFGLSEKSRKYGGDHSGYDTLMKYEIQDILEDLPSVTLQPKVGRWIGHREYCESLGRIPSGLCAYYWCSNCDCAIDVEDWYKTHYNFCPKCGSKMKE